MTTVDAPRARLAIGAVLTQAVGAARRNTGSLLVLAVLFSILPSALFGLIRLAYPVDPNDLGAQLRGLPGENLVLGLLNIALAGAVARVVVMDQTGDKARLGEAMKVAGTKFFPLLGLTIITGIAIAVGLLLLIVPGVILMAMWAVTVPLMVTENTGVGASMSRSIELTRGNRWPIIGVNLVWVVGVSVVLIIFSLLAGAIIGFTAPDRFDQIFDGVVIPILVAPFYVAGPTISAVVYCELKRLKGEPIGDRISEIFT